MLNIAIVGQGYVGTAYSTFLSKYANVVSYDAADDVSYPVDRISKCDFGIVCVDTPTVNTQCDISKVAQAVKQLPLQMVLIKSTIPPGTTEELCRLTEKEICFSPEYIGEANYHLPIHGDPSETSYVVLGASPSTRRWFLDRLEPIFGPTKQYIQCSAVDAELTKYMENCFLATKVTFVNEFRRICEAFNADWHAVREAWLADPRVGRSHTSAFANSPGFSGKCLPKDLQALITSARRVGYDPQFLDEVMSSNQRFQNT